MYCCCSYLRTHRRKKSKKEAERILLPSLLLAAVAAVRPFFSRVCSTTHLNGKIWGKNKESQWCTCISFQQKCSIASNCFWNSITFSGYTVYWFFAVLNIQSSNKIFCLVFRKKIAVFWVVFQQQQNDAWLLWSIFPKTETERKLPCSTIVVSTRRRLIANVWSLSSSFLYPKVCWICMPPPLHNQTLRANDAIFG